MTEVERLRPPMVCNHSDEGKADCDALRAEVCAELKCEPDGLVNAVVHNLQWIYGVEIDAIPCDMWSAVTSKYRRYLTEEEQDQLPKDADDWVIEATAYVECDRIEDGFAQTWKTWKEWFESRAKS